jgi:hypothetical protein
VLDGAGFLDVQMAAAWWADPDDRPQPVKELAGQAESFVLLAADGAGKSTVLRGLRALEPGAIEVDLRVLDRAGMRDALREAVAAGGPVYLDALDVAARLEPALFLILEDCLTGPQAVGVPWRLACRPAAWDRGLAAALELSLPVFRQLRLLPLTRAAATGVVSEVTGEAAGFLDALVSAGLGRMAASPMRLQSAARQWADTGRLPDSQLSAIRFEVDRLLEETSNRRPRPAVALDRRRRLAGRLAAMTVFGRADHFTLDPQPPPGALYVVGLPSAPEPDEPGQPVTPAEYEEVLGTGLFDAAADATVGFRHQQYAEFLAAEYVTTRRITRPQLPALLGMHDNGAIPGPLTGAAAWLAALSPDLASDFAAANADRLAQAAVELPSPGLRASVVSGILARAAAQDIDTLPGQDLTPLAHPGLKAQLADRLDGGLSNAGELWWIAGLARGGQCRELTALLVQEVLSSRWPPWARRAAAAAVADLGEDADVLRLQDLARLGPADDPDDDVLAAVIEALYPRLIDTAALLAMLRPQRNTSYLGPYLVLLGGLATRIPADDLPEALGWATEYVENGENAYGDLIPRLVRRGWEDAASSRIREPLARLIAGLASDPGWDHWPGNDKLPWDGAAPALRRELAVLAAAALPARQNFLLADLGLLVPGDLGWLLAALPSLPGPKQDPLARCVPLLARQPTAAEADLILGLTGDHPAHAYTAGLRETVSIDSPIARQWRQRHELMAREAEQRAARQREQRSQLMTALRDAGGDPRQWWHVAEHLAASDAGGEGGPFSGDLTARPGWPLLDAAQRQQVLDLGVRYLSVHKLQPQAWMGHPSVRGEEVIADWSGTYLLTTLARHDRARLAALPRPVWRAWAPAIIGAWTSGGAQDQHARCQLIDLVPQPEEQAILDAALDHLDALQENGGQLTTWSLYEHLCSDLAPALAGHLLDGRYHGCLAEQVLHLLVKCAPDTALPVCRDIANMTPPALAAGARRGLAELDPATLIDNFEAHGSPPKDIADVAEHLRLSLLDDPHLAVLARLLLRCVPFATDPPEHFGISVPDRLYQVRRIRRIVMDLLAEHGQECFFGELAAQHDGAGREVIAWYRRQARAQAADLAYSGLSGAQLLHLLSRADARLVRNASDLLDVIVFQLDDLQRELTQLGHSRFLWDLTADGGTPKDEDTISDWIRRELRGMLTAPGVVDREVQVSPRRKGMGTRIDLKATMPTATHPSGSACVIAEAKLITHRAVLTALHDQLVQRYLIPAGLRHGIYLVYWTDLRQRHGGPSDRDQLLRELIQQAASAGDGLHVRPYILDISHP